MSELRLTLEKTNPDPNTQAARSLHKTAWAMIFLEEIKKMHARPEIRQILIARKLRRWLLIAQHPFVDRSCPAARARKNYWRLFAKYPEIAAKLNLTELSVYRP